MEASTVISKVTSPSDSLQLYYLPLRGRAEPLRLMLHYANMPFEDIVIPREAWPEVKPHMPPGLGSELPDRPMGNRGVPVLKIPPQQLLPESRDIAAWIASHANLALGLMPADPETAATAKEMFDASAAFPLIWPTIALLRLSNAEAEKGMRGEFVTEWLSNLPSFSDAIAALRQWEARLGPGPFFGGQRPHYGEFGLWACVDALQLLAPERAAQFGAPWQAWHARMAGLPGAKEYLAARPQPTHPGLGFQGSVIMEFAAPASRPRGTPS